METRVTRLSIILGEAKNLSHTGTVLRFAQDDRRAFQQVRPVHVSFLTVTT